MSWYRQYDGIFMQARRAGQDGREFYFAALCHCSSLLLGDVLPFGDVDLVASMAEVKPRAVAGVLAVLSELGLLEESVEGWIVRQHDDARGWARTVADVEAMREKRAAAGRASAKKRQGAQRKAQQSVQHGVEPGVGQNGEQTQTRRSLPSGETALVAEPKTQAVIPVEQKATALEGTKKAKAALHSVRTEVNFKKQPREAS